MPHAVNNTVAQAVQQKLGAFVWTTEKFVQEQIKAVGHDASHDWSHIDRVRKMALTLAREEGNADLELVEIASLLHDIQDWKYSGSETAAATTVKKYLQQHSYPEDRQTAVLDIIQGVGFKAMLLLQCCCVYRGAQDPVSAMAKSVCKPQDEIGTGTAKPTLTPELAVVQDADRLDAIGAIGIARCFTYGGRFARPLYDPKIPPRQELTKSAYMDSSQKPTTINHFYEKLLKLQKMMKTDAGRRRAKSRHDFMEAYLQEFMLEWDAQA